jgi:hypothetical protein
VGGRRQHLGRGLEPDQAGRRLELGDVVSLRPAHGSHGPARDAPLERPVRAGAAGGRLDVRPGRRRDAGARRAERLQPRQRDGRRRQRRRERRLRRRPRPHARSVARRARWLQAVPSGGRAGRAHERRGLRRREEDGRHAPRPDALRGAAPLPPPPPTGAGAGSSQISAMARRLLGTRDQIIIEGFADSSDSDKNAASLARASRVRERLIRDGVPPDRVGGGWAWGSAGARGRGAGGAGAAARDAGRQQAGEERERGRPAPGPDRNRALRVRRCL